MRINENDASQRDAEGNLIPTPGQTIGPFFGYAHGYEQVHLPFLNGNQLVNPGAANAVRLYGTVYDGEGQPIPDAMIEIWQADENGKISREDGSLVRDGFTFTGWGRGYTDNVGRYTFSTVEPGVIEEGSARFISVVVFARGLLNKLHTRVYLPEDREELKKDKLFSSLDEKRANTLVAERTEDGSLKFDIWIQGDEEHETQFFQFPGMEYPGID